MRFDFESVIVRDVYRATERRTYSCSIIKRFIDDAPLSSQMGGGVLQFDSMHKEGAI